MIGGIPFASPPRQLSSRQARGEGRDFRHGSHYLRHRFLAVTSPLPKISLPVGAGFLGRPVHPGNSLILPVRARREEPRQSLPASIASPQLLMAPVCDRAPIRPRYPTTFSATIWMVGCGRAVAGVVTGNLAVSPEPSAHPTTTGDPAIPPPPSSTPRNARVPPPPPAGAACSAQTPAGSARRTRSRSARPAARPSIPR